MSIGGTLIVACIALLAEAAFGYPRSLFRLAGHPVTWIGAGIGWLDRQLNRPTLPERRRRLNGALALALLAGLPALLAWAVQHLCLALLPHAAALLLLGLLAATLPAQRSLFEHVRDVRDGLAQHGLAGGRAAVGRIVGRDTAGLDEAGIVRAAIESLAENFSDGVVAPLLWCALLGLPGIVAYKAVNTADSMIGHLTPRYGAFGWAAARFDDLVNLPGSRLAAAWIVLAALSCPGASAVGAVRATWRDARHHRSPNAGWPEAAMAGALGLRLAGPRVYGGVAVPDRWMGDGRAEAGGRDLDRALSLYRRACMIEAVAFLLLGLIVLRTPAMKLLS